MPISRKRACAKCRAAKARCSLEMPRCSRCAERRLRCDYADHLTSSRTAPYPEFEGLGLPSRSISAPENEAAARNILDNQTTGVLQPTASPLSTMISGYASLFDWGSMNLDAVHSGHPPMPNPLIPSTPLGIPGLQMTADDNSPLTTESTSFDVRPQTQYALQKRPSFTPDEFFTTKVILGQVESYPRMMIDGLSLPPFIHSTCGLDDYNLYGCSTRTSHQCLPKTLSICASLVRMFYTRTPTNSAFAWEAIYNEAARLHAEYENYECEAILESLQALCIYVILQAQDPESRERNNVQALIAAMGDLAFKLFTIAGYEYYSDVKEKTLDRRRWAFQEGTRRTMCLIYIIETLLDVIIGRRQPPDCQGYTLMPVPCVRALWEAGSTSEWASRYRKIAKKRKLGRVLNVDDLKTSSRLPAADLTGTRQDGGTLSDVMEWCEGLDQYGTMVWMTVKISKDRG